MLISWKGSLIKSIAMGISNGTVTLILLLIAPMGLAGVITTTIAVMLTTLAVSLSFDLITLWLIKSSEVNFLDHPYKNPKGGQISSAKKMEIELNRLRNLEDE
ncbi:hypothetical protein IQ215_03580 [Cyanobacterium stanieri LEGE 03274]|uniref:Membrane transport protein MMPL domain-containing protein n=1 Tax=Cyanobacterium stanieri LEGE 03274 TaxID=1828756 RepID=A0ABR9V1K6_9CHRO|nr:CRISPR-associated protein Csx18 [Cyanobacterium stanieri]MBE9221768.1 hypothetical protein [Cyanobacterium stanieri LEGE 03274]